MPLQIVGSSTNRDRLPRSSVSFSHESNRNNFRGDSPSAQPTFSSIGREGNAPTYPMQRYATGKMDSGIEKILLIESSRRMLTHPTPSPSARAESQRFWTARQVE